MPLAGKDARTIESEALEQSPTAVLKAQGLLEQVFGAEFHFLSAETGETVCRSSSQPVDDLGVWSEICREVARRRQPEFIACEGPFLLLAIPLQSSAADDVADIDTTAHDGLVAISVFLSRPLEAGEDILPAARVLGLDVEAIDAWTMWQNPWPAETLLNVGRLFSQQLADRQNIEQLHRDRETDRRRIEALCEETQSLSENLSSTYEEISLLYRLTQNLQLSKGDQRLGRMALEWLEEVVPAESIVLLLKSTGSAADIPSQHTRDGQTFLTQGKCPVDAAELSRLIDYLDLKPYSRPFVANLSVTSSDSWPCKKIRQAVIVPLAEGENIFGWLAALNHINGGKNEDAKFATGEFGTVEASLLGSVGTILGIHSGNIDLYRQQSEMFSGIVRALTSAIDAKDRYTCGHSDRVARISVRLANELGCDEKVVDTIYLAGLLHDIGKIGIDDQVLRKPGKLSDEEYEHIKRHSEVGHHILNGLKQMDDVLPVVLHHHESWDGRGYPHRLPDEEIPFLARIVAVADSYDAMSSDRPYRRGMPEDRIDGIFHAGSGKQWDPRVVAAFFSAREDIRKIAHHEPDVS